MADSDNRPANAERGEFSLPLGGEDLVLRPSFEAIAEFERETGKGLIELTRAAATGTLTMVEMAVIACACIRAWGRATDNVNAKGANPKKIAELIIDSGALSASTTLSVVLALAATGGVNAEGEMKATTTNPTTA